MKGKIVLFLLIVSVFFGFRFGSESVPPSEMYAFVVPKMITEIDGHPKLIFSIKNCERIGSELLCGEQKVCLQTKPFKCRIIMIEPNLGDQIVYDSEKSQDATYIPMGFPFVSLELDPLGDKMRKNNHHSIFELGFQYFSDITAYYYENHKESFTIEKKQGSNGVEYVITSELNNFRYKKYVTKKKETPRSLAHRKIINEYLVYEKNKFRESYKTGDTLLIPNYYYKKFQMTVDGRNFLPSLIKVYDDKGLFEKYEFSNVEKNPSFDESTFQE